MQTSPQLFFYNPFGLPYNTLTITKSGTGTGTVTSSLDGINCGAYCSDTFVAGIPVELVATPTLGTFTGWSGACSGTGPCVVTMDAAKSVVATFIHPTRGGGVCRRRGITQFALDSLSRSD